MNIRIIFEKNKILLEYKPRDGIGWLEDLFYNEEKTYKIRDIFEVNDNDFYSEEPYIQDENSCYFLLGELLDDKYYHIFNHIINTKNDVLISKSASISLKYFGVSDSYNLNILKKIEELIQTQIIITDETNYDGISIPINQFESLIAQFPTRTEQLYYTDAKITNILSEYVESTMDGQNRFDNYIKRKNKRLIKQINNFKSLTRYEIQKYEFILQNLKDMLNEPDKYDEDDWQNKILEVILLIFPKYILSIKEFKIPDLTKRSIEKRIDIALFDANGNIDIIEIKKPNAGKIITDALYRKNHIPARILSGSIMQTEKYLYLLNILGKDGENKLNTRYKNKLEKYNIDIKINNPRGIIITGDSTNFSKEQKLDFDIIEENI